MTFCDGIERRTGDEDKKLHHFFYGRPMFPMKSLTPSLTFVGVVRRN